MRAALVIAAKDLRQKLRDRSVLLMAVAAPLGLAFLFSTMIPSEDTFHTTYAVVDLDQGEIARGLVDGPLAGLAEAGVATLVPTATEAEARAAVEAKDVAAAIVIPAGFSAAVQAGEPGRLLVIGGSSSLPSEVARSVLAGFGSQVTAVQVAVGTALGSPARRPIRRSRPRSRRRPWTPGPDRGHRRRDGRPERLDEDVLRRLDGRPVRVLRGPVRRAGPAGRAAQRHAGTDARGPDRPGDHPPGQGPREPLVASISMTVIVVATTVLLGADWGDPLAVAALMLAVSLSATGIATLVVGFARNEEQAGGFIAVVAMTLAVFGGSFFRMCQAPEGLAVAELITPQAWFLRGINDLAGGGGIAVVVPSLWC